MIFADLDPDRRMASPYYNIDLTGIRVAGKQLSLNSRVFVGEHSTTYTYLPDTAFAAFEEAVMKEISPLKHFDGLDPNFKDTCLHVAPTYCVLQACDPFIPFNQVKLLTNRLGYTQVMMPLNFQRFSHQLR